MMFISETPDQVAVRPEVPAVHDTHGRLIEPKKRRIVVRFSRGHAPQWVKDVALKTFEFRNRPIEIPPESWVAYYDSIEDQQAQGWTDEEREIIEEYLSTAFFARKIEEPELAKPWPSIDKLSVTKSRTVEDVGVEMTQVAKDIGVPLADVAAYVAQNIGRHGWTAELATALRGAADAVEAADAEDLVPA